MKINDFNSELELMNESDVISEEKETSVNKKPMSEKTEILSKRGSHSKTFQEKKGRFCVKHKRDANCGCKSVGKSGYGAVTTLAPSSLLLARIRSSSK